MTREALLRALRGQGGAELDRLREAHASGGGRCAKRPCPRPPDGRSPQRPRHQRGGTEGAQGCELGSNDNVDVPGKSVSFSIFGDRLSSPHGAGPAGIGGAAAPSGGRQSQGARRGRSSDRGEPPRASRPRLAAGIHGANAIRADDADASRTDGPSGGNAGSADQTYEAASPGPAEPTPAVDALVPTPPQPRPSDAAAVRTELRRCPSEGDRSDGGGGNAADAGADALEHRAVLRIGAINSRADCMPGARVANSIGGDNASARQPRAAAAGDRATGTAHAAYGADSAIDAADTQPVRLSVPAGPATVTVVSLPGIAESGPTRRRLRGKQTVQGGNSARATAAVMVAAPVQLARRDGGPPAS